MRLPAGLECPVLSQERNTPMIADLADRLNLTTCVAHLRLLAAELALNDQCWAGFTDSVADRIEAVLAESTPHLLALPAERFGTWTLSPKPDAPATAPTPVATRGPQPGPAPRHRDACRGRSLAHRRRTPAPVGLGRREGSLRAALPKQCARPRRRRQVLCATPRLGTQHPGRDHHRPLEPWRPLA